MLVCMVGRDEKSLRVALTSEPPEHTVPQFVPPLAVHGIVLQFPDLCGENRLTVRHARPVVDRFVPATHDEVPERLRPRLSDLGSRPLLEHDLVELGRALDLREGLREAAYLPEEDPEGVNVARETVAEPEPDLRGHIPGRSALFVKEAIVRVGAADGSVGVLVGLVDADGETEVEELEHAHRVEPDVGRLEVAEDNVQTVKVSQGVRHGHRRLGLGDVRIGRLPLSLLPPPDAVVEGILEAVEEDEVSVAKLERVVDGLGHIGHIAVAATLFRAGAAVELDDVGVVETRQHGRLVDEVLDTN